MTATIIHLDPFRRRPCQPMSERGNVVQIPIRCPDLDSRPVPVHGVIQGDPDELISFRVYSHDGLGTYLARGPSRSFLGRFVMTPDGLVGFYRGHFNLRNGMKMARVQVPEKVLPLARPLQDVLLMPETFTTGSAA